LLQKIDIQKKRKTIADKKINKTLTKQKKKKTQKDIDICHKSKKKVAVTAMF